MIYSLGDKQPVIENAMSVWIADTATVIGDIDIGEYSSIWFGAVLRGDNEPIKIGSYSNIQEQVVIHTDIGIPASIGKYCTIGHKALLHGCTLDDNVLVGMGAIIMNGSHLGKNSIVGAGALVTEGKSFPENSLILGCPAKVVRQLRETEIETIHLMAERYHQNALRFKKTLVPIG